MATISMPDWLRKFFSHFPIHVYEQNLIPPSPTLLDKEDDDLEDIAPNPTLCIIPPVNPAKSVLSADVECLKWQAYLALRGVPGGIRLRWDLHPEGALDRTLPNLYLPAPKSLRPQGQRLKGELLEYRRIPSWVDGEVEKNPIGILEGYKDEEARDESRAWITLLGGDVHSALQMTQPQHSLFHRLVTFEAPISIAKPILSTSLNGMSSLIPPIGSRFVREPVIQRYKEAITALSARLNTEKWFLGSSKPTALDALAFAYIYSAMESSDHAIRNEIHKWVNLVAWERKVRRLVESVMHRPHLE